MNQKMKSLSALSFFLFFFSFASAQQLEVIEPLTETTELSAAQHKEYDANGNPCALIKLGLIANDPVFEGSVIKSDYNGGVYWIYLPQGTNKLTIQTSNYLPLRLEFEPVKSLFTYHMAVGPKSGGGNSGNAGGAAAPVAAGSDILPISIPALPSVNIGGEAVQQSGPVNFNMVRIKHGKYQMGATSEQNSQEKDETPVHYVTISKDYYIGETEVTQALWERIMGTNPSAHQNPNNPVENISYNDALEFCLKLSQLTKKTFRLPTEAEWEYAARGAQNRTDTRYAGNNTAEEVGWYALNSGNHPHEVKTKKPNEAGLYDMSGNVWEICEDYKQDYSAGDAVDPVCRKRSELRVRRGGCWGSQDVNNLRVAYRRKLPEKERNDETGLRIVMEVE